MWFINRLSSNVRSDAPKTPGVGGIESSSFSRSGGTDCLQTTIPSVGSPGGCSPGASPMQTPHSEPPASVPPALDSQHHTPAQSSPQAQMLQNNSMTTLGSCGGGNQSVTGSAQPSHSSLQASLIYVWFVTFLTWRYFSVRHIKRKT